MQLYKVANKNLPTYSVDPMMLSWLDISPTVEAASSPIIVLRIAPPDNWTKLSCDETSKGNHGHSEGGGILRDHKRDF